VSRHNGVTTHIRMNERDTGGNLPEQTGYAVGTSLLARRKVIEHIGLMPEMYFLYMEEVDWQHTAKQVGWRIWYAPESVVRHKVSATVGNQSPFQVFHLERSRTIFVFRHLPGAVLASVLFSVRHLFLHHIWHRRWRMAAASVRGVASGILCGIKRHSARTMP